MKIVTSPLGLLSTALLVALMLVGGCSVTSVDGGGFPPEVSPHSHPQDPTTPPDDGDFWMAFQMNAHEVDPARSLEDLTNRAELIVTGKVLMVEENGPVDISVDGIGPPMPNVAVVVRVDDVLKGALAEETVRIAMALATPTDFSTHAKPSGHRTMFFLKPRLVGGGDEYYVGVTAAAVVEDTPHGLVAVRDPSCSVLFDSGSDPHHPKTFQDLVEEVTAFGK